VLSLAQVGLAPFLAPLYPRITAQVGWAFKDSVKENISPIRDQSHFKFNKCCILKKLKWRRRSNIRFVPKKFFHNGNICI
jgi:hypothetical protein